MQVSPILFTQFNQNKTVQPSFRGRYQAISNEPQSDYYDHSKNKNDVKFGGKLKGVGEILDKLKPTGSKGSNPASEASSPFASSRPPATSSKLADSSSSEPVRGSTPPPPYDSVAGKVSHEKPQPNSSQPRVQQSQHFGPFATKATPVQVKEHLDEVDEILKSIFQQ